MNVFIGGAWPYANGSLHLGHVASLLPGDILARYYRLKGENVLYVSGSDCNGTPISIRAKQEGVDPKQIVNRYHHEFIECFSRLGFTFDCYTRTDNIKHHETVQQLFLALLDKGLIYKKEIEQTYCENCSQFLPDRYVEGICPNCSHHSRGDQCDNCSKILDPIELIDKKCQLCCSKPTVRLTEHFYFALSTMQSNLEEYLSKARWRENAINLTGRYLKEGLKDRAVSRDIPIGVTVPIKGYEEKKIYVWIEAVTGYYSASKIWAEENNKDESLFWNHNKNTKSYYVHGKDNIPFHTIIWPAILMGLGDKTLPTNIVSNEYLTVEKKKLSTSKNWAVWVPDLLEEYQADSIRYFLTTNAPENRDTDFSWREFIYSHNSELLGAYGNFVNRTLKFIEKYYSGVVPSHKIENTFISKIEKLYETTGKHIEEAHFKQAIEEIFEFIRSSNKFFDEEQPWINIKTNKVKCDYTMATCVFFIINLAQLLSPFLPFSSEKIMKMLDLRDLKWTTIEIDKKKIYSVNPLFERIDAKKIDEEVQKLNDSLND